MQMMDSVAFVVVGFGNGLTLDEAVVGALLDLVCDGTDILHDCLSFLRNESANFTISTLCTYNALFIARL